MMYCKYGKIDDYVGSTYEELIEIRKQVVEDIVAFEEDKITDKSRVIKPGAEYEYRLNMEFLADLIRVISRRFQEEHRELLRAIGSGEFKVNGNEGTVAQVKRYTRLINETKAESEDSEVHFAVDNEGNLEAFIDGELAGKVVDIYATGTYDFDDLNGPYLLLEAECHNRRFIGAGSRRMAAWEIYSDGSYRMRSIFNLKWDELESASSEEADAGKETIVSGTLDEEQFRDLKKAISKDVWRNTSAKANARDKSEWMIVMYDEHGNIVNTSGDLDYIYGVRNLEAIVACLPSDKRN